MDEPTPAPTGSWPPWVETWVLPYVDDFMLWPVLAALVGHVWVLLVPVELAVVRGPDPFAMLAIALLLAGTGEVVRMEWRARGRLGALTLLVTILWAASVPLAWLANEHDVF